MTDPWESVDLTLSCDSDEESSLARDGEPVITIPRLQHVLEKAPSKIKPTLAQRFIEIYSRKSIESSKDKSSLESIFSQCKVKDHLSILPSDESPERTRDIIIDSVISISAPYKDVSKFKRIKSPSFHVDARDPEEIKKPLSTYCSGTVCEGEVIEIDDDSNDQILGVVASSAGTKLGDWEPMEDDATGDQLEKLDIKYHYGQPPATSSDLVVASPDASPGPLVIASPEPHTSSLVSIGTSSEPPLTDVPNFEMAKCGASQHGCSADNSETESIISIGSDEESENCLVQHNRTFSCRHCDYSCTVHESYLKHIAGHLPPTIFCTECSYSVGSELPLLSHLAATHGLQDPLFYRSSCQQYICRVCLQVRESRKAIEGHLKYEHVYQKKVACETVPPPQQTRREGTKNRCVNVSCARVPKKVFQCAEDGCAKSSKSLKFLCYHVQKHHNVKPISYYEFLPQGSRPSKEAKFGCFRCDFKGSGKDIVRRHAEKCHSLYRLARTISGDLSKGTEDHENQVASSGTQTTLPEFHSISSEPQETSPESCELPPRVKSRAHDAVSCSAVPSRHCTPPVPQTPLQHPTSPEPESVDDEVLVDMPECDDDGENVSPPYDSHDVIENEGGVNDSDYDSDNPGGQPPRTFTCIYCEYSTVIEEWYHKHVASHLPDPKPYSRLYCTECSYSTGLEKYLLFHMTRTHGIRNPEFYRSGEKVYTCRICRHTQELRIGIESHIKEKHKSKKALTNNAKKYQTEDIAFRCSEEGCHYMTRQLGWLRSHVQKQHNIRYPLSYYEFSGEARVRLACFCCHKTTKLNTVKLHAKQHYTRKQREAPYLYKCHLQTDNARCMFSCRKSSNIVEHYHSAHSRTLKYYKRSDSTFVCIACLFKTYSLPQIESHCLYSCKNR